MKLRFLQVNVIRRIFNPPAFRRDDGSYSEFTTEGAKVLQFLNAETQEWEPVPTEVQEIRV
ncbi:hypothetical protein [Cupriavidus sp. RAF12]|uniref:hypothetical protein n=1 Tax=Cupriavidus sp. RAF12 TaxID=3233050 RepID=UPI003F90CEDA